MLILIFFYCHINVNLCFYLWGNIMNHESKIWKLYTNELIIPLRIFWECFFPKNIESLEDLFSVWLAAKLVS